MSVDAGAASVIPFSRPFRAPNELRNLELVLESGHVHGDGSFTRRATERIRAITRASNALLTTSCTHALELASLLLGLGPGDEVILPSYTFPSAADAVATRGARILFADIDPTTGNVDPESVQALLTERTAAVSVMHYGGVAVDMDAIMALATPRGIPVIEDNAHGLGASFGGRKLGSFGVLATQSFHDTKNVHCGEGGALLVNDPELFARAEVIREKGTNRQKFLRGQVDKYTWVDVGSSYLPSELNAAVLDAQLEVFDRIQELRQRVWQAYATELRPWAEEAGVTMMTVPERVQHPAHMFWMLMPEHEHQTGLLAHLRERGITATFHYQPLDQSPAGRRYGSSPTGCRRAADFAERVVRLPLWAGLGDVEVERVIDAVQAYRVRS